MNAAIESHDLLASLRPEGIYGIYPSNSTRWQIARHRRRCEQCNRNGDICQRIDWLNRKEESGHQLREHGRGNQPEPCACRAPKKTVTYKHQLDTSTLRTERNADSDLASPLRD